MKKSIHNNTSSNLDSALLKIYYDKVDLAYIIINKEKYYLLFTDESIIEIIHNELQDDDIFKIILLIDEAKILIHQETASAEGLQEIINKYFSEE